MIARVPMSADARPYAYIRRSVVSRNAPGDTSRDMQTEAVRELAGDDGNRLVVVDADWGRSGSRHEAEARTAFRDLLAAIEGGEVSGLYAYATDRLARDVEAAARLLNLCERAGVTIVTREGRYPPGDRMARAAFNLAALMNEDYSTAASGKQADAVASRRRRGDQLGPPPYGHRIAPHAKGEPVRWEPDPDRDPAAVLAAYRESGSLHGAARLLNDRGVRPPARGRWASGSVGRILHRAFPHEFDVRTIEPRSRRGDPADGRAVPLFRRLVRCHCGGFLTPTRQRDGSFVYRCNAGYVEPVLGLGPRRRSIRPGHPNGITVSEKVLREWAVDESAKWDHLRIDTRQRDGDLPNAVELAGRKRRAGQAYTRGALDEAAFEDEMAEVERLSATIADQAEAKRFLRRHHGVEWTGPSAEIAAACRRLWSSIHLNRDMRPVRAEWRVRPPLSDAELDSIEQAS